MESTENSGTLQPGFMVLHSNRLESLREVMLAWLERHPLQALEPEILLVQSNGMAQWLKLALASDTGIAAALDVTLPGRFQWAAYRAVLGDLPETSPFDKPLLAWRLLRLLPTLLDEAPFRPLRHFLSTESGLRRHFQLAQRLADLYDQYQIYRADWLNDWAQHRDLITRHNQQHPMPSNQRWQAELWRRLLADMPPATVDTGRAQIHQRFLEACRELPDERPTGLPRRVVVFGLSSLPQQGLEVLSAISRWTQVILCVQNPSMHYWGDMVDPHTAQQLFKHRYQRQQPRPGLPMLNEHSPENDLDTLFLQGNPLLAAWGKQGRDYLHLLDEYDQRSSYEHLFQINQQTIDVFEAPTDKHLLGLVQSGIYYLRNVEEERKAAAQLPEQPDSSLSFHIAHSAQREVEILQDYLLDLFDRDPDLKPRDILVMVPDINQFAPHIQAVFGRIANREDKRYIPFTLSDQGKREQSPLYAALGMLLEIDSRRFTASELLDLIDVPAIRAAFEFDDNEQALLRRWIDESGIRWGLNASHRQQLGLPAGLEQNTWHSGLKRMLLGYASGPTSAWLDTEPFAEVAGLSASLAGRLAKLLRRLEHYWQWFREPATVTNWAQRLHQMTKEFFVPADNRDVLLLSRIEQDLEAWREACEQAQFTEPLPLEVVREYMLGSLDELDGSQRFLVGSVNFATLMPMRAIPFRHICLLGMNDSDYPRRVNPVDFDLMRHDYRPGDRSRRDDDRYLFLEALLSARSSLYISWSGRHLRDDSERPASVLVAQLRDHIASITHPSVLAAITTVYPLQPFSRQYFLASSPCQTFAHEWEIAETKPATQTYFGRSNQQFSAPGPTDEIQTLNLNDLAKLLSNPAEVYFEKRLGIRFPREEDRTDDDEPFTIDGLEKWQLRAGLLNDASAALRANPDTNPDTVLQQLAGRLQGKGKLPLPPFAPVYSHELLQPLTKTLHEYHQRILENPFNTDRSVHIEHPDGNLVLEDQVTDIQLRDSNAGEGQRLVILGSPIWAGKRNSKQGQLKWHYLARQWPRHLAAQLQGPVITWLLGPETCEALAPLTAEQATAELQHLLQLWAQNLQRPLRAEVRTSCALLTSDENKRWDSARKTYEGDDYNDDGARQGEVERSYALSRLWQNFEALVAEDYFADDSQALYQGMIKHWDTHRSNTGLAEEDA